MGVLVFEEGEGFYCFVRRKEEDLWRLGFSKFRVKRVREEIF